MSITVLSAYRFVDCENLSDIQASLEAFCRRHFIKGTILLSQEGINIAVAGNPGDIDAFRAHMETYPAFTNLFYKISHADFIPFKRLKVKIKSEIITFQQKDIHPASYTVKNLPPKTLKSWLDAEKEFVLLDTRNDYELEYGMFEKAVSLGIDEFTELPEKTAARLDEWKDKTIVMMCTGGVRCEKAGVLMEKQGYKSVYQLEGGILQYFLECGAEHYRGGCFVFDDRISITPEITTKE